MLIKYHGFGKQWLLISLIVIGVFAYVIMQGTDKQTAIRPNLPEDLQDVILPQAVKLVPFTVIDQHSTPFTLANLKGKWSLIYFGFTNCPDACPTALAELDDMVQLLEKNETAPKNIQIVFVTLDPDRDTAKEMEVYLNYFNSQFIGLTGNIDKIRELSDTLGIFFSYDKHTPNEYSVMHSSAIVLVDPETRYIARFPEPYDATQLADWLLQITQLHL